MRLGPRSALVLLAVFYTALNAARPLLIDDAAYEYFSRHIAQAPLDPYGFDILWYDQPQPANEVLAPPVLPYYWALVRSLVGDRPSLWKLALLPWALLLVFALHGLFRRFGRGHELLFTAVVILSPGLLPSFNLMLDVPALALGLTALRVFQSAAERGSLAGAAGAGLLAGVAMQTKYNAALAPGAMLIWAALEGRWRLWLLAAGLAAFVFVLWEALTAHLYGHSHFLLALGDGGPLLDKLAIFPCLFSQLGGAFPLGALFALAALGAQPRWLVLGGGAVGLGYALIALFDVRCTTETRDVFGGGPWQTEFDLAEIVFNGFALAWAAGLAAIGWRLREEAPRSPASRDTLFLLLWLGLEALGYVALTPFPAVRRVLGVLIVGTLLLARLPAPARPLRAFALGSALLGGATFALDWHCAAVHRDAAEEAARLAQGGGTVWYVGHWGFQFYAERAGMRPIVADRGGQGSRLRAGDWLVVPDGRVEQQRLRLEPDKLRPMVRLTFGDAVPLTTFPTFYGGRTPIRHHQGTRLEVDVYRVTEDFTAK